MSSQPNLNKIFKLEFENSASLLEEKMFNSSLKKSEKDYWVGIHPTVYENVNIKICKAI